MEFHFGPEKLNSLSDSQQYTVMSANGLGGFLSMTGAFSVTRCDQGILIAAPDTPNARMTLVHRLREMVTIGSKQHFISTQQFGDEQRAEGGYHHLQEFTGGNVPSWHYEMENIFICRKCAMEYGHNRSAVVYEIENRAQEACRLEVEPCVSFAPKQQALSYKRPVSYENMGIHSDPYHVYFSTNGQVEGITPRWGRLLYPEDAKDGRTESGWSVRTCRISVQVEPGEKKLLEIVFSACPGQYSGEDIIRQEEKRLADLENSCPYSFSLTRHLVKAADRFIVKRGEQKSIVAGYPLFADWGRDSMIAIKGCCLSAQRFQDAKSILRTFFAYERNGLVPNLFPENGQSTAYNAADASLLLIDAVWDLWRRTGDREFLQEAYPVMERIMEAYEKGTDYGIHMDEDGLIAAGQGNDQVTWMDVYVEGVLPTPRHGKPVEINAFWYNALKIMEQLAPAAGKNGDHYREIAKLTRQSFREKFYMPDKGYLKDVLSGTFADTQIRCNQICAVSMSFTMLDRQQEKNVVNTVSRHLLTPCGLRTLSPKDAEYRGYYGGPRLMRDLAYHQGSVWVFPLGAYYEAYMKIHDFSRESALQVQERLQWLVPMLKEGCVGQLPELYDGDNPSRGKGCYAQALSVGEMLRISEMVENILNRTV